jgi:putative transposase
LWPADITYVPTLEGWLFLGVVVDMYSRRIVGWSMRDDLKDLVVDALAMAVTRRLPPVGLVHHSNRGSQYTSLAWRRLRQRRLRELHLDAEARVDQAAPPHEPDHARLSIFQYIETFYNPRRHSALGGISPDEYERRCLNRREEERIDTIEATRAA